MKTIELLSDSMQKPTAPSLAATPVSLRAPSVPANEGEHQPAAFSPPAPEVVEKKSRHSARQCFEFREHEKRFKGKMPKPFPLPEAAWINKPEPSQEARLF